MFQVLLGDMGTGKTSLVLRFVKGQFFDFQVWSNACITNSELVSVNIFLFIT